MKKTGLLLSFFLFVTILSAQDRHFTQFFASPLTFNPANAGGFSGKYRIGTIYRDQWRAVLDNPYRTFSAAFDLRYKVGLKRQAFRDRVGVGIVFFSDKVSGVDFNTNQINVVGAYHKSLNPRKNTYLSLGFKAGVTQRNINYEKLTFQDQFDDEDDFSIPTNERLPANNYTYFDYAFGLNYSVSPNERTAVFVGVAMSHFHRPYVSFYDKEYFPDIDNKLFAKYTATFGIQFPITKKVQLSPRAMGTLQGPHLEINAGSNVRVSLSEFKSIAIHFGSWVRPVTTFNEKFEIDAIIGLVGIEFNNVFFGISYDANLTDLTTTRQGQGALEISIAYLGEYENESVLCPKF